MQGSFCFFTFSLSVTQATSVTVIVEKDSSKNSRCFVPLKKSSSSVFALWFLGHVSLGKTFDCPRWFNYQCTSLRDRLCVDVRRLDNVSFSMRHCM